MNNKDNNSSKQFLFLEPPKDFSSNIEVVACYIKYHEQILFLKRHPTKPEGGTWCVPGGKRDAGETLTESMLREISEESGLIFSANAIQYIRTTYLRYPKQDLLYHLFKADLDYLPVIQLNEGEHQGYHWATHKQAKQLILTPGIDEALDILFNAI